MAFTGTATVKKVADDLTRITGLSLAGAASGTIGLSGTGDVKIQDQPDWEALGDVTLQDAIQVTINGLTVAPVSVTAQKSGTDQTDFLITFTNRNSEVASGGLEIYVRFRV